MAVRLLTSFNLFSADFGLSTTDLGPGSSWNATVPQLAMAGIFDDIWGVPTQHRNPLTFFKDTNVNNAWNFNASDPKDGHNICSESHNSHEGCLAITTWGERSDPSVPFRYPEQS